MGAAGIACDPPDDARAAASSLYNGRLPGAMATDRRIDACIKKAQPFAQLILTHLREVVLRVHRQAGRRCGDEWRYASTANPGT